MMSVQKDPTVFLSYENFDIFRFSPIFVILNMPIGKDLNLWSPRLLTITVIDYSDGITCVPIESR